MISGASQGLGKATAMAFAAEGAHVAICARNVAALNQLADLLRERFGVEVHSEACDVHSRGAVQQFVRNVHDRFARIDVCVTNAGGPPAKQFLETTQADWEEAFALNLRSAVDFSQVVIPYMQKQQWGRIVTISSITVKQPQPQLVLSNAIRAGILGLVRSLANEFGKDGITINNVGPGYTATDRLLELAERRSAATGKARKEIEQSWISQIPLGRLGQPQEIADAVVWLASERAAFVTGQTILVDGGMYQGL
ncbi:MAG TPA: SDR family oxidoreductase [Bryobacteraceae bacterium]|nr:SDR family oxidoreductase [Bryobacteraceae bacterium]